MMSSLDLNQHYLGLKIQQYFVHYKREFVKLVITLTESDCILIGKQRDQCTMTLTANGKPLGQILIELRGGMILLTKIY